MKTYGNFFEDIEQRRAELAQRKKDQMAQFKQKTAQSASDMDQLVASNKERIAKNQAEADRKKQEAIQKRKAAQAARDEAKAQKEKDQAMKDEIKQELANEREERRKDIEKKRMEKERAQAEDQVDLKETIKSIKTANPGMVDFLEAITEGTKFKKFDADSNWKKTVGTILTIKVDLTDVDAVSKKLGIAKKTVSNHKVVDVNLESLLGIKVKGKVNNKLDKLKKLRRRNGR